MARVSASFYYERHRPNQTMPYGLLQQHAASFIAPTEATAGVQLPRFIKATTGRPLGRLKVLRTETMWCPPPKVTWARPSLSY
jgi:hypothetical protein